MSKQYFKGKKNAELKIRYDEDWPWLNRSSSFVYDPAKAIPGVYYLVHDKTGMFYIGSSKNIPRRIYDHKCTLDRNERDMGILDYYLQDKLFYLIAHRYDRPDGLTDEQFKQFLLDKETEHLQRHKDDPRLINYGHYAGAPHRGKKRPESHGRAISAAKMGKKHSPERRKKWMEDVLTPEKLQQLRDWGMETAKKIYIEGTVYDSLHQASRATGVSRPGLKHRIISPNFPEYYFVVDKPVE